MYNLKKNVNIMGMVTNILNVYVGLIVLLKIILIILSIIDKVSKRKGKENKKILQWKNKIEFLYNLAMALLIIFIFFPKRNNFKYFTWEIKYLLFIYGIITVVSSDWGNFFSK